MKARLWPLLLCVLPFAGCQLARAERVQRGPSKGCGTPAQTKGSFSEHTIQVNERERSYRLRLPRNYDPKRPYALIFRWHGTGGNGASGGLEIEKYARDDAIIVAPDGLHQGFMPWTREDDVALFDELLEHVETRYCVDRDRVYSYGFSAGGTLTNVLACKRGDVLRATASIASGPAEGRCKGPVSAWFLHDLDDPAVSIAMGRAARDRALAANGCSKKSTPLGEECVRYLDCTSERTVVWCETKGLGHDIRGDYAPQRVWQFFSESRH